MTTSLTTDDPIVVLHRYYLQVTHTRRAFEQMMKAHPPPVEFGSEAYLNVHTAMGVWYGALYVVAEGWCEYVKPSDPTVDALIADPKLGKLKAYRNAVFHFQRDYFSPKLMAAMDEPGFVPWVTNLNRELGRFFLEYFRKHRTSV